MRAVRPRRPFSSGRSAAVARTRRAITPGSAVKHTMSASRASAEKFRSSTRAPPPVATTASGVAQASATASCSSSRKRSSPSRAKISRTVRPARRSTIASVSRNGRARRSATRWPTTVFPVPMKPVSTTRMPPSRLADLREVAVAIAQHLPQGVAAELLERDARELEGDDGLRDHRGRGDRHDVGALDRALRLLLRVEVDRRERAHQGGERLERDPHDQRGAVRHAALGAAREVGDAAEAPLVAVVGDLVLRLRAAPARRLEPDPDLDALRGLQREERSAEAAVELAVVVDVAAEPRRQSGRDDLDHAAERVARLLALVDERDDAPLGIKIGEPDLALLRGREDLVVREALVAGADVADLAHPGAHLDAERPEQALRERADRDPHRRLAGARTLEDVAHVAPVVLEGARQIGVPGARARHDVLRVAVGGERRHLAGPVPPVAVLDDERDRRTEGLAEADPGSELHLVALDLHAAAAPVALLATGEVAVDVLGRDGDAGRKALHDRGQCGPMRLPGGEEAKHGQTVADRRRALYPCGATTTVCDA